MGTKLVQLNGGKLTATPVGSPVTWLDWVKAYYAKAIVVLSALAAGITMVTPVLNFMPAADQHYVTGALAFIAAAVALLRKEQGLVDDL